MVMQDLTPEITCWKKYHFDDGFRAINIKNRDAATCQKLAVVVCWAMSEMNLKQYVGRLGLFFRSRPTAASH